MKKIESDNVTPVKINNNRKLNNNSNKKRIK